MVNVRKNAMREYHNLVHKKKYMEQSPKKFPSTYKYMSVEELDNEQREYKTICSKIELLKEILEMERLYRSMAVHM